MKIQTRKQIFKSVAIAGTIVAPATYMTKKHMDFYPKSQPQQRKNIRNRMIGFFTGMLPGLLMVHRAAKKNLSKNKNLALGIGGAALTFIGGKIGLEIARSSTSKNKP